VTRATRLLFVVAAGRDDLAELLRRQFADVADSVEVVSDRRSGERRFHNVPVGLDRRHGVRRRHDVRGDLESIGWALVRRGG
jgi:hypothetical protein